MRKILLSILLFSAMYSAHAQYTLISHSFAVWLNGHGFSTVIHGDSLDVGSSLVTSDTNIDCSSASISSLDGIQYFINLHTLKCNNNSLDSFPTLPGTLLKLECQYNSIDRLPTLPSGLLKLICDYNSIDSLPVLTSSMTYLTCKGNGLSSLPVLPTTLTKLDCGINSITVLPTLPSGLTYLGCGINSISSLPVLPSSLLDLYCSNNSLSYLPTLPSSLRTLNCVANSIDTLPALPTTLFTLDCSLNPLGKLPTLPPSLISLNCNYDGLDTLPALPASLIYLNCYFNSIDSLPLLPASLTSIQCFNNPMTILPSLPASLTYLACNNTWITSLPALPSSLSTLYCNNCRLTTLPTLPPSLVNLNCSTNSLSSIPTLPSAIRQFYCTSNASLTCLPYLPNGLQQLKFSFTSVGCMPNVPPSLTTCIPSASTLPLCDPYISSCGYYWNVSGTTYEDENSDCLLNLGESGINGTKLQLKLGSTIIQQATTRFDGIYSFDTAGYHTFTVEVDTNNFPLQVCPSSLTRTVTTTSSVPTVANVDFGLNCKTGFDVGVNSLVLLGMMRPASIQALRIGAGDMSMNHGLSCTSTSGRIVLNYNGSATYSGFSLGSLLPDTISAGRLVWTITDYSLLDFYDDIRPEFFIDTYALSGDTFSVSLEVYPKVGDLNNGNNDYRQTFVVRAAYDPNLKEVSPPSEITADLDWLTYTIHFQNTGTAAAEHVFIIDTIDSNVDLSSIQMLTHSHECFMQVLNGRVVKFNFPYIELIDSTTDEPNSHGYVQYRIKPRSGLSAGDTILNTADIYFDFNPPIQTNTTVNFVACYLYNTQSFSICPGDSVIVGPHTYASTGTFIDVLTSASGCDSTVTTSISTHPYTSFSQSPILCAYESISVGSHSYNISGTYYDTLTGFYGCDSFVTTNLSIRPSITSAQSISICAGDTLVIGTHAYTSSGTYTDVLTSFTGCDSTITTNLHVIMPLTSSQAYTVCSGHSIAVGSHIYSSTGVFIDHFSSATSCDSVVYTTLTVLPAIIHAQAMSICAGDVLHVGSNTYSSSGTFYDSLSNASGCDSIVTTSLTVYTPSAYTQSLSICGGEIVRVGVHAYTNSGTYTDILSNGYGCDSTITTHLDVTPSSYKYINIISCSYTEVHVGAHTYTHSGIYYDTLTNYLGCDSFIISNLTLNATTDTQFITICNGDVFDVGTNHYTTAGVYSDVLLNHTGCDSLLITHLTVLPSHIRTSNVTICHGESYTVGTSTYNSSGTYSDHFAMSSGCDSLEITNLTVTDINTHVNVAGNILSATSIGVTYQWLDCENAYFAIPGEINQTFSATINGNYAVEINDGACKDTSTCIIVNGLRLNEVLNHYQEQLSIYPNPTNAEVFVSSTQDMQILIVRDVLGNVVNTITPNAKTTNLNFAQLSVGMYLIEVRTKGGIILQKVVKD